MNKLVLVGLIVVVLLVGYGMYTRPAQNELTVLSWDNYIGPNTLKEFEEKFNVKVVYEIIKSNEEALARIKANPATYDVAVISDYMVKVMNDEGLLEKIDASLVPNMGSISSAFRGSYFDANLESSVPYAYGTTGFGVNTKYFKDETITWKQLADPKYKGKVTILDDSRYVLGSVLLELGFDPNTTKQSEIDQAVALLKTVTPNVQKFTADTPVDLMVSEGAWISYGYSGDIFQMNADNTDIKYMVPLYGTLKFLDNMLIPKDAPHATLAHDYINFILDPKVSADITNEIKYGNPNDAARAMIESATLENPAVFPTSSQLASSRYVEDVGENLSLYDQAWEAIKQ